MTAPGDLARQPLEAVGVAGPRWLYFRVRRGRWFALREVGTGALYEPLSHCGEQSSFSQVLGPFRFRFLAMRAARGAGL